MAWNAQGQWIPDTVVAAPAVAPTTALTVQQKIAAAQAQVASMRAGTGLILRPTTTPPVVPPPATVPPLTPPVPGAGSGTVSGSGGIAYPQPAPTYDDASVANQLEGLLSSDSPYMQQAQKAGIRTAGRRGLLNSSIAVGASEAAAIAAAAPIASQDASQIQQTNLSKQESYQQYNNATRLQSQQDAAAMARQLSSQDSQASLQGAELAAAMARLGIQVATEKEIAAANNSTSLTQTEMNNANALTQTQINANVDLVGNYMNAFAAIAQSPDIPATTRDAYVNEMKVVVAQGMGLTNELAGTTVTWTTPPPLPAGTPTGTGTSGYTAAQLEAMKTDGIPGNYAAATGG